MSNYPIPKAWPEEWQSGIIKTHNAMGGMSIELCPSSKAFVNYAAQAKRPLVDIGAAYGVATYPAIAAGATVIACDIAQEHLNILSYSIPETLQNRLITKKAAFPYELDFTPESLSGILISQVLHFLDGTAITDGLKACYDWLEPNGKLFISVATPYLKFLHKYIPLYEAKAAAGETWPGQFTSNYITDIEWKNNLPSLIQLFKKEHLVNIVQAAGFKIETADYFHYRNAPSEFQQNGQEYLSVIAVK